jgi:hypothetical protein
LYLRAVVVAVMCVGNAGSSQAEEQAIEFGVRGSVWLLWAANDVVQSIGRVVLRVL